MKIPLILLTTSQSDWVPFSVLLAFVAFFILIFITRAIFSIGTIVKNLKAQTKLLALIASEKPENLDKVDGILNETVYS